MFGTYFYNQRIRKSVAVFGKLFNNLYVIRKDGTGKTISSVKVPLAYAPKRKFLERIQENPSLVDDMQVAIKLPRMSFEIVSFVYDGQRQVQKMQTFNPSLPSSNSKNKFFTGVPYNINFQLNIYAKNQDDALQIIEQIIPFFNPQYTLSMKPFEKYSNVVEDTPIVLQGVSFTDDFEGTLEQRRTIVYTLDFEMKVNFYGAVNESNIIRDINVYLSVPGIGATDSDQDATLINIVPDPVDVSPDSDFGFTTTITSLIDSSG